MFSFLSSKELIGHCLCKDVKVKIDPVSLTDKSNEILVCHCSNCQRAGGGLLSYEIMLPDEKVTLIDDKSLITRYDDTDTKSKNVVERYFCRQCGSPIYGKTPKNKPNITIVKLSLFAGDQLPCPTKEVFCAEMMKWEKKIDGAKHYDEGPE
ncbi:unnamed protein product [Adineta steineri]|uniref:CENP-V/GFA domain-containing protein n=1 Tax=Adineta steineri TaxID=433720 RepID=A0A819S122_9BILA|nr:unnamed protein product [Adineta steineri]CAF1125604.1 unnamed protein product [Adineta steineri]CAF1254785.1 unnamed protein product [Adineta steineri]CAF3944856.1 unnamed protein product [Adineta steineri]CAF4056698.1 unnamed protein product [Adineta steineri]